MRFQSKASHFFVFQADAHTRCLTFSGLTLPHQECSSSVLQVQKEPLRVTPSDLPKIPPAKVGHRESVPQNVISRQPQTLRRLENGILLACTLENLFLRLHADVQKIRTKKKKRLLCLGFEKESDV